jgi:hypothetical protein
MLDARWIGSEEIWEKIATTITEEEYILSEERFAAGQGTLAEAEGSVHIASYIKCLTIKINIYIYIYNVLIKTSYYKEVHCTEPSLSVRVPCPDVPYRVGMVSLGSLELLLKGKAL